MFELDRRAFAAADPATLQRFDTFRPVERIEFLNQTISVLGNAEHPLPHRPFNNWEPTYFTLAVNDFFVR